MKDFELNKNGVAISPEIVFEEVNGREEKRVTVACSSGFWGFGVWRIMKTEGFASPCMPLIQRIPTKNEAILKGMQAAGVKIKHIQLTLF